MNLFFLAIAVLAGWLLRRSSAQRMEQASLRALPRALDGIIEGAAAIEHRGEGRQAVLILHGFGDTPQTVRYLADHLHRQGFTVRAPLLAGHGRTLREFSESTGVQWLAAAEGELLALQAEYDRVAIVGVSMGGALAVILAERAAAGPDRPSASAAAALGGRAPISRILRSPVALVLIAPYLSMRAHARQLATWHWVLSPFIHYLPSREEASIRDAEERRSNRGFGTVTPGLLSELQRIVARADAALPAVAVPTLVIHSRGDNRIDADAALRSFDRLGASEKRIEWIDGAGHVITVDVGRGRVFDLTAEWLLARMGAPAGSRGTPP